MSRLATIAVWVVLALPARAASAGLDADGVMFSDRALGLTLQVPEGWTASTQTGYPGLLLLLQAPGGRPSRMLLTGGELPAGKGLEQVVAESLAGMRAVGLTVARNQRGTMQGRSVWEITARAKRDVEVRQVYLVQGRRVFSITLAGPSGDVARLQPELNQIVAGLRLE